MNQPYNKLIWFHHLQEVRIRWSIRLKFRVNWKLNRKMPIQKFHLLIVYNSLKLRQSQLLLLLLLKNWLKLTLKDQTLTKSFIKQNLWKYGVLKPILINNSNWLKTMIFNLKKINKYFSKAWLAYQVIECLW